MDMTKVTDKLESPRIGGSIDLWPSALRAISHLAKHASLLKGVTHRGFSSSNSETRVSAVFCGSQYVTSIYRNRR